MPHAGMAAAAAAVAPEKLGQDSIEPGPRQAPLKVNDEAEASASLEATPLWSEPGRTSMGCHDQLACCRGARLRPPKGLLANTHALADLLRGTLAALPVYDACPGAQSSVTLKPAKSVPRPACTAAAQIWLVDE